MTTGDFRTQIFKTTEQWESGLLYRLEKLEEGITIYSVPNFSRWIQNLDKIENFTGLALDGCGQIYFTDNNSLYLYDPRTMRLEYLFSFNDYKLTSGLIQNPSKIILDKLTLWVLDKGNNRVLAFFNENFQIKYIIEKYLNKDIEPVDIEINKNGYLYVLDKKNYQVLKYDVNGSFINGFDLSKLFDISKLKELTGIAINNEGRIYIIDKQYSKLISFTEDGQPLELGDFTKISEQFQPSYIGIDEYGSIFIVDDQSGSIFQFDSDGSYVAKIQIPDFTGSIQGLCIDSKSNLYVITDQGIAFFYTEETFSKEEGIYFSKVLDSGIHECQWHGLAVNLNLPAKTFVKVFYYSFDDPLLKSNIDKIFSDKEKPLQDKKESIDNIIPEIKWIGPETFSDKNISTKNNAKNMLFRQKTGRYLLLKLSLSTFDETVSPSLKEMKVYYPRNSYLRYLPATYQEDPASKNFLESFLSIFETVFYGLDTRIENIFRYFDVDTVPQNFLSWIASWLNFAIEEDWDESKKYLFIKKAAMLYKYKGTSAAIEALIEIYTGNKPIIIEHSKSGKPFVLGGQFRLGVNSLLVQTPIRGFRLGDDSILGCTALRDVYQLPEDPFLQMAYRFTVMLDLSAEEYSQYEIGLKKIIDEAKPAHTIYNIRLTKEMEIGMGSFVGINTRVAGYQPIQIGINSTIGSNIIKLYGEKAGRIERHSKAGKDTLLI